MKLKDFVKQTLMDITNGVAEAQRGAPLWIAPGHVEGEKVIAPQLVSFEVGVTTNTDGGGEISVWSVGSAKAERSVEHVNKIAFSVPVYFQARKDGG